MKSATALVAIIAIALTAGFSREQGLDYESLTAGPPELARVALTIDDADSILAFDITDYGLGYRVSKEFPHGVPDSVRLVGTIMWGRSRSGELMHTRNIGYIASRSLGKLTSPARSALRRLLIDRGAYERRSRDRCRKCPFNPRLAFEFYNGGQHVADCLIDDSSGKWTVDWEDALTEGNIGDLKHQHRELMDELGKQK